MTQSSGLDFGDQYCVIGVYRNGGVDIISNQCSNRLTPTMVTYTNDRRFAGEASQQQRMQYVNCTFTHLKRLLSLPFSSSRCEQLKTVLPFDLVEMPGDYAGVSITFKGRNMSLYPEQCVAYLFKDLVKMVRNEINDYVISVPQCWSEIQRRSLLAATKLSGINCLSLLNSNAAAAIAYFKRCEASFTSSGPNYTIFIDVGNSAMNIACVNFQKNLIEMMGYASDPNLGGSHYNEPFAEELLSQIKNKYHVDPTENQRTYIRFLESVEKTKRNLSVNKVVQFELHSVNGIDIVFPVQRDQFDAVIQPLINNIPKLLDRCLNPLKIRPNRIKDIELLGGGSRVVAVQQAITNYFKKAPSALLNLDECFAVGCTYFSSMLNQKEKPSLFVKDILPYDITATWSENNKFDKELVLFKLFTPLRSKKTFDVRVVDSLSIIISSKGSPIGIIDLITGSKVSKIVTITAYINRNGVVSFTSSEDSVPDMFKYTPKNMISPQDFDHFKNLEIEMAVNDQSEEAIDELRNALESEIFLSENIVERDFTSFFSENELETARKAVLDARLWFEEKEFDRLPPSEYEAQVARLKAAVECATKRGAEFQKIDEAINDLRQRSNILFSRFSANQSTTTNTTINEDQMKENSKLVQEIVNQINFLSVMERTRDPPFDIEEIEGKILSLECT